MLNTILKPFTSYIPENNRMERVWILAKTTFIERYYGSKLGVFWALINPFFKLTIYYLVFTVLFSIKIPNYAIYVFSGLIVMMFFSESTSKGVTLLRQNKSILENINIKKLDLYYATIISSLMGFGFNLLVCFIFSLFYGIKYSFYILYLPLVILNIAILILAAQLFLGVINIFLHDIIHLWDMILLSLFWSTPIFYSRGIIIEKFPALLYLNPMAGILTNLRQIMLFASPPNYQILLINLITAIVLLIIALAFFKKYSPIAIEKL